MSCSGVPAVVQCVGIQAEPTKDPHVAILQQQVCALQAQLASAVDRREFDTLALSVRDTQGAMANSFARGCDLQSLSATLGAQKEGLQKTLQYAAQNHQTLASRTDKLASDCAKSDRAIVSWIANLEAFLQGWQQFEFFRMTQVTALISDAACRAENDYVLATNAIAGVVLSDGGTSIKNALTSVLNLTMNYIRGADLKSIRNREFITGFTWGTFGSFGIDYGFAAPGYALVGAIGLV